MIRAPRWLTGVSLCLFALCHLALWPLEGRAAEVIIIGDTALKPVVEIISGIKEILSDNFATYSPADVKGRLDTVVARENARAVIALGNEAIKEAMLLPAHIAVIYDLVILPPKSTRPNTTGLYMGTPVGKYLHFTSTHLPVLKHISVVSSPQALEVLGSPGSARITAMAVSNSLEFINTIKRLDSSDALLLLPDVGLLTSTALEEIFLYSFRARVPILGISEKHVRQGALFALVFDPRRVGRVLGERTAQSLAGIDIGKIPPSPSTMFDLYVNQETAKKMGIPLSDDILRMAKGIYP